MAKPTRSGKAPANKRKPGRPSLYRPEYCQALIEWAKKGLSYESFASVPGVALQTLYEWEKAHPEFSEAKKTALPHSMVWWEKKGMSGDINPTIWIFNMKNRFGWRDTKPEEQGDRAPSRIEVVFSDPKGNHAAS